ncbi:MAG: ABC transporter ATP-binding protein [Planctomycetota bacterium]
MSEPVVECVKVSKKYLLRHRTAGDAMAVSSLADLIRSKLPFGSRRVESDRPGSEVHWALRDVTFDVAQGEALGIIGRNGAGKSTLLKIISRLTLPSEGRVSVRGRIGSMLEVGVGFKNELTGRENIALSGAILGIPRREIRQKTDEIIEFSGIRPFIDVPVKRYSSGMRIRLAFAVMATLEPEVLLIDEVLSVGDAEFKRRSAQRMEELIRSGRTVLFVSHNRDIVERLCDRAIELDRGQLVSMGATPRVADHYARASGEAETTDAYNEFEADPERPCRIRLAAVLDQTASVADEIEMAKPFRLRVGYDINEDVDGVNVFCRIETPEGIGILCSGDADYDPARLGPRRRGAYIAEVEIDGGLLEAGAYRLTVSVGIPFERIFDREVNAVAFRIVDRSSRRRLWYPQTRPGLIGREYPWVYDGRSPWA